MKRALAWLLALVMCLSLCACAENGGSAPTEPPQETQQETEPTNETEPTGPAIDPQAIEAFRNYVLENAEKSYGSISMLYYHDHGLEDITFYAMVQNDVVILALTYDIGTLKTDSTSSTRTTFLYLTGAKDQMADHYYGYQSNTISAGGIEMGAAGAVHIAPGAFTQSYHVEVVDFKPTENNANAKLNDEFIFTAEDGLHTAIELFGEMLEQSGLGMTLADFGFAAYEITGERTSDIRSGKYVKPPVEPAPLTVTVEKIVPNSVNAPELYAVFTNTGDTAVVAFDFYVYCYDAYGDVIKGYGTYDAFLGLYQDPVAPGASTPANLQWTMNGFENTKSVEIAVVKYKLEGGETVEIPAEEYVWFKQ